LRCIHDVAARNEKLLRQSDVFSSQIENTRLSHEVAVIHIYARHIVALLQARDPLREKVHLSKPQFAFYGLTSVIMNALRRIGRTPAPAPQHSQRDA
jgi:predicted RNase H-like nuclease